MPVSARSFAKQQRQDPTDAEHLFWFEIRNRLLGGYKFTRQVPIGNFTVDFVCRSQKLIVELDGGQHWENNYDEARTNWLNKQGYGVVRFWNNEIFYEREAVLETLLRILEGGIVGSETGLRFSPALPPERVR